MLSTLELLDLAKQRQGIASDYRLAQLLGVRQPTMTGYRKGRTRPDFSVCMRLGELCGLDPHKVVLWVQVDRAQTEIDRQIWREIGERLALTAGVASAFPGFPPATF